MRGVKTSALLYAPVLRHFLSGAPQRGATGALLATSAAGGAEAMGEATVKPDARSLRIHRQYMNDGDFAKFERGDFGIYGGAGLGVGAAVPADLALETSDGTAVRVAELGAGGRPVVLNFGSCS